MAFIVFEGLDHSGKSTLIQLFSKYLNKENINFVSTREPGGTSLGENIRSIVLNPYDEHLSIQTEILLITAGRKHHIDTVITPALEEEKWIICDRFWPSTFAFQGAGRGIPKEQVQWLHNFIMPKHVVPDLYILLDMSVTEKERRCQLAGNASDCFEIQDRAFHQRVREYYLSLATDNKKDWLVLNALLSPEELITLIVAELKKRKCLNS